MLVSAVGSQQVLKSVKFTVVHMDSSFEAGGSNCVDCLIGCKSGEVSAQVARSLAELCFVQILVEVGCPILLSLN